MKSFCRSIALCALSFGLIACWSPEHEPANPSSATPASLVGTEWLLRDLAGTPALASPQATLAFPEPGRVAGNGSCNRFTGSVEISGNSLKFGPLASTRMACTDNRVSDQEDRYFKALGSATLFALENGDLLIYSDAAKKPLRFARLAKSGS